ncbi:hypothetical protein BC827DRAFT_953767 [Russula dissimulans]|nr:hypothetical protein BC827DRAFT_953767 [Russula dissimulans]
MVDHLTIQCLPNELLLHVFSFHRLLSGTNKRPPSVAWRWHTLAHVCQRWRDLIFMSLRHLKACLVIPRKSPETPLDSWPALPLSVWYDSSNGRISDAQRDDLVAAFEHSDRIRELSFPMSMGDSVWTSICNKSFLELEHLALEGLPMYYPFPTALPREFLGGSTGPRRLRSILLNNLYLPALPELLLCSLDLVSLHLGHHTLSYKGFISPEVLSTALSALTQLEYLHIDCLKAHVASHTELTSLKSSPHDLLLPALTYFHFGGFFEYMENLVSRIHAPHLEKLDVYSDQSVLDIPQLSQLISRTERLTSLPSRTSISLDVGTFSIEHHFGRLPSSQEVSRLCFRSVYTGDWQVSRVGYICTQLSPFASIVKQLKISVFNVPPNLQRRTDPAPWLPLLTPYNSVEEVEFRGKGPPCTGIAWALQESTQEAAQELLPALRVLRIRGFPSRSIRSIMSFATARRLTGRPVIVRLDEDTDWVTFENGTCKDEFV